MGKFIYQFRATAGCIVISLGFSEVLDYIRIMSIADHPVYRNRFGLGFDAESIIFNRMESGRTCGAARLVSWRCRDSQVALPG
jgi:hypothetical protein